MMVASAIFLNLEAYMLAAVFYVGLVMLLQAGATVIERRLGGAARAAGQESAHPQAR